MIIGVRPGSVLWLLAHELRLAWRQTASSGRLGRRGRLILIGGVLILLVFVAGTPAALAARHLPPDPPPVLLLGLDLGLLLVWTLMLSQTLSAAAMALYERGDLDLLLSSPLPARRVMAVRGLGIAVMAMAWFAAFATPFVLPMAILASARWLAVYVVLIAAGLLAAAVGLLLAMALFAVLGARRTRSLAQVMAAVIGAAFFLVGQARNLLPGGGRTAGRGLAAWAEAASNSAWLAPPSPLVWPAQALLGRILPLLVVTGLCAGMFGVVVASLGRRFGVNAAAAAGVSAAPARRAGVRLGDFKGGPFAAVLRKELRLLARDPALLSQALLRVLYLLPLMFVLLRNAGRHADFLVAGGAAAVVIMTGQLVGSLTWITISAEDSPDLLACAPVPRALLLRAKIAAAVLPAAALLAIPCVVLAALSPVAGVGAFVGAMVSAVSAALIGLWYQKPAKRKDFRIRRSASILASLAGLLVSLAWAAATALFVGGSLWCLAPGLLGAVLLALLRRREPGRASIAATALPHPLGRGGPRRTGGI